jgi:orotidine-5'-phosphate decarboxylase
MNNPVIVALDYPDAASAMALAERLSPSLCRLKVGKELFTRAGPALVDRLQGLGFEIFLDLKFHDIPNTVAGAVRAAADLGVWMVNVHASGGARMMESAREAVETAAHRPLLIGVTVLTSMSDDDLASMGYRETAHQRVLRLADMVQDSGLDGVVCSAQEATELRAAHGQAFCLVTPGIRFAGDDAGDQRRVVTPADAMQRGSTYLVIGRSITGADDPLAALERVHAELRDQP